MVVEDLLKQSNKLPNVPDVVKELIQQLNNPNADYQAIAEKVAKDQTLSLKILRLVNSAHFGLRRKISSINEAVIMLGMARLKTLVIASGVVGSVKSAEGLNLYQFWSHAFGVATQARWLAEQTATINPDTAFTTGLIHNAGQLLLHTAQPALAIQIQQQCDQQVAGRTEAEQSLLGFTSPEAGEALLKHWQFPAEISAAVRQHRHPDQFQPASPLACCIHLAELIHGAATAGAEVSALAEQLPKAQFAIAGIPLTMLDRLPEALALESGLEGLIGEAA